MVETRSRRNVCPFCGHIHIYEVVCVRLDWGKEIEIPDSITRGRIPSFARILNSDGDIIDEETMNYGIEEDHEKIFEKQYFFNQPKLIADSREFDGNYSYIIDIFWKCKQCLRTWSPVSKRKFSKCPNCGMSSGISIEYGYPGYLLFRSIHRGEICTGGCCIDSSNRTWICIECGHSWGSLQDEIYRELINSVDKAGD